LEISGSAVHALAQKTRIQMTEIIRDYAPIVIVVMVSMCAFYLERMQRKIDAIHYILQVKYHPETLAD
jgi:hypothetical protein